MLCTHLLYCLCLVCFALMDNKTMATSATTGTWEVSNVTVKLPTFYTLDPLAWFQHVEAQFGLCGISVDETKFWHMLASLDADTSARASCVVTQATDGQGYATLKVFLIKCYSLCCWQCVDKILATIQIGDRCPSHLTNFLLTILGECSPDILLLQVFMLCLLAFVQDALAGLDITDLETLVDRAG